MTDVIINECWRSINLYPKYQISNCGRVRNVSNGFILKAKSSQGYPRVALSNENGTKLLLCQRLVAEEFIDKPLDKLYVDHLDHDRNNNSVTNLRWVSSQSNNMNRTKAVTKATTSTYKGVSYVRKRNVWEARIKYNNETYRLGYWDVEEDAAHAYNVKAIELFGKYAFLNVLQVADVLMFIDADATSDDDAIDINESTTSDDDDDDEIEANIAMHHMHS